MALHLKKLESPSPRDTLCQVWLKLAQWFWRRRWKCEKFTDRQTDRRTDGRTDGQTDDGRQVIRKAHLSFQLRWAKRFHHQFECLLYVYFCKKVPTPHDTHDEYLFCLRPKVCLQYLYILDVRKEIKTATWFHFMSFLSISKNYSYTIFQSSTKQNISNLFLHDYLRNMLSWSSL